MTRKIIDLAARGETRAHRGPGGVKAPSPSKLFLSLPHELHISYLNLRLSTPGRVEKPVQLPAHEVQHGISESPSISSGSAGWETLAWMLVTPRYTKITDSCAEVRAFRILSQNDLEGGEDPVGFCITDRERVSSPSTTGQYSHAKVKDM
eukprot:599634-Amorphochlora_amoeboformis.AAC.2